MRIIDLNIESFGHFEGARFGDLDEPVVCFSGPNEVGKSTVYRFIKTMLYGIHPSDADKNPDVPFEGRFLQGALRYKLDDGRVAGVARKLRSEPDGEFVREDLFVQATKIRNKPVPDVSHVTRRVFEHVYQVGLIDLTKLDDRTFREIQDRLLGSLNATDVRSAAAVIAELDTEAKRLFRTDRKGKPRVRVLAVKRATLQDEVAKAQATQSKQRRLQARAIELESLLSECRSEEQGVRAQIQAAELATRGDVRRRELDRLLELARLSESSPDLPENPLDRLGALRAERDSVRASSAVQEDSAWFEAARGAVFAGSPPASDVATIDTAAVRHIVARHRVLLGEVADGHEKLAACGRRLLTYVLLGVFGALGPLSLLFGGQTILGVGGLAIVLLALLGLMFEKHHRTELKSTLAKRRHETTLSRRHIDDLVGGLEIRDEQLDASTAEFLSRLSDLVAVAARMEARRESTRARTVDLDRQVEQLESRLADLGDGDVISGAARLQESRIAAGQARVLSQQIGAADAPADKPGDLRELRVRLSRLEGEVERMRREQLEVHADLGSISKQPRVDEVYGELEDVERDLESVRREHDRLRLLEGLVRVADQRFRETHQPDVIARANSYLQQITGGRYQRIFVDEKNGEADILASGATQARPLDSSVSQGTRDQVYLSLRLALADHLDAGMERLPIFLDEVFVTWDEDRRARTYDILAELSKQRQVFLFTCHPWLEDEVRSNLQARIVSLAAVSA